MFRFHMPAVFRNYVPLFAVLAGVLFSCSKPGGDPFHLLRITPPTHGKVKGYKVFYKKDELTHITAAASEGYAFSHWTGVPDGHKTQNPLKLKVTADLTLGAVFIKTHKLTLITPIAGMVRGHKTTYNQGELTHITVTANAGYAFSHWTGVPDGHKTQNPLKLKVTADLTLGAVFIKTYKLTLITPIAGMVRGHKTTYNQGELTHITVTANAGYAFSHWTGVPDANKKDNPLKIAVTQDLGLAVIFVDTYTLMLTSTPTDGGMITKSPDKPNYTHGETVTLTATPKDLYGFKRWTGDVAAADTTQNPLTITIDSHKKIGVEFGAPPIYLDANGKTLKAAAFTQVGETHLYKGETYTIADSAILKAAIKADKDMTKYITTKVIGMSDLFNGQTTFNGDIGAWDVSNVRRMTAMFSSASDFNQDLGKWDVSGVTDMSYMFYMATAFDQDLGKWDVSGVTDMSYMFYMATAFDRDLTNWDVSGVKSMVAMFSQAASFNGDLSKWDVSGVTDMNNMFSNAPRFNGDLSKWDVSGVTRMNAMFSSALAFNGDLAKWDVSRVTDMSYMFATAQAFDRDLAKWDVSGVTDMQFMFFQASRFNQDLSRWCVEQLKSKPFLFDQAAFAWKNPKPNWGKKCSSK